ncbi:MAG: GTP cyclohydrolase FolE2 [Deltaproteobacteria bacterium]|nr:GTP cyclohydrolase FolE2 [Deltaproteobacteria bacterium]
MFERLPDIQNRIDGRNIPIDQVGVSGIRLPITVLDKERGVQHTIGEFHITVDLQRNIKGTHMSRFIEEINNFREGLSTRNIGNLAENIRKRFDAKSVSIFVSFPFFKIKVAPVSKVPSLMEYNCKLYFSRRKKDDIVIQVDVPVTTLCPCSKEISRYGAHNQRTIVSIAVRYKKFIWIEELIKLAESAGSCEIYSLLKRVDEKYVTEKAYRNPMFVEDVVRKLSERLSKNEKVKWFMVRAESIESIHNHNAFACIVKRKR